MHLCTLDSYHPAASSSGQRLPLSVFPRPLVSTLPPARRVQRTICYLGHGDASQRDISVALATVFAARRRLVVAVRCWCGWHLLWTASAHSALCHKFTDARGRPA